MNPFQLYFTLGWQHIVDWQAIDHWLFIAALCLRYQLMEWKKILLLITAFTIGHSITLALSALHILVIATNWIEFLIPCTIFCTAAANFWNTPLPNKQSSLYNARWYALALFFGCIHGLGFSNYLKSMLGKQQSILIELLSFNIGIEIAQIGLIGVFLLINYATFRYINVKPRDIKLVLCGAISAIAIQMMAERWP